MHWHKHQLHVIFCVLAASHLLFNFNILTYSHTLREKKNYCSIQWDIYWFCLEIWSRRFVIWHLLQSFPSIVFFALFGFHVRFFFFSRSRHVVLIALFILFVKIGFLRLFYVIIQHINVYLHIPLPIINCN